MNCVNKMVKTKATNWTNFIDTHRTMSRTWNIAINQCQITRGQLSAIDNKHTAHDNNIFEWSRLATVVKTISRQYQLWWSMLVLKLKIFNNSIERIKFIKVKQKWKENKFSNICVNVTIRKVNNWRCHCH